MDSSIGTERAYLGGVEVIGAEFFLPLIHVEKARFARLMTSDKVGFRFTAQRRVFTYGFTIATRLFSQLYLLVFQG